MAENITGRDWDIIVKALVYSIATIDELWNKQEYLSDQADMQKLLNHMVESYDDELVIVRDDK